MENAMTLSARLLSNMIILKGMDALRSAVIAARTKNEEMGISKAMMISNLKNQMKSGVAHFVFVKKNGELREAYGTTQSNIASAKTNGRGESRENFSTTAFFDCCKGEWRSFRWETLIAVL